MSELRIVANQVEPVRAGVSMSKWSGRSWWSTLGLGKRAADEARDFGDMGTAFGLDASMAGDTDAGALTNHARPETEAPASPADRQHRRSRY